MGVLTGGEKVGIAVSSGLLLGTRLGRSLGMEEYSFIVGDDVGDGLGDRVGLLVVFTEGEVEGDRVGIVVSSTWSLLML